MKTKMLKVISMLTVLFGILVVAQVAQAGDFYEEWRDSNMKHDNNEQTMKAGSDIRAGRSWPNDKRLDLTADQTVPLAVHENFSFVAVIEPDRRYFDMEKRSDAVIFDWLGHTSGKDVERHSLSLEILTIGYLDGNRYLGFFIDNHFVNVSLHKLEVGRPLAVVLRIQEAVAELFVDGVVRARKDLRGMSLVGSRPVSELIAEDRMSVGRDYRGRLPFEGTIGALGAWNRALADEEIARVSGVAAIDRDWTKPQDWRRNWAGFYEEDISLEDAYGRMYRDWVAFFRRAVRNDPWFPRYHLTTPGFMTEPSMSTYKQDAYHVFPHGHIGWRGVTYEEAHYWHHFMSEDLLHWKLMPFPQWPHPNTGNMIEREDETLCFPQNSHPREFIYEKWVSRDDDLRNWSFDTNVELPKTPTGLCPKNHYLFEHEGEWYFLGAYAGTTKQHPETAGRMELYRAIDDTFENWEYRGLFYQATAEIVHHPRLFFVEGKAVMDSDTLVDRDVEYVVGRIENERFVREGGGSFQFGYPSTVWGSTITEADGGTLRWALIRGVNHEFNLLRDVVRRGWQNAYSIPRETGLRGSMLTFQPARELEALRRASLVSIRDRAVGKPHKADWHDLQGFGGEIEVTARFAASDGCTVGIELGSGDRDRVRFLYDSQAGRLEVDFSKAKYGGKALPIGLGDNISARHTIKGEVYELRLFFDRSIIEVYADGQASAGRWYLKDPDAVQVRFFAEYQPTTLISAEVWEMGTIWEDYVR